MNESKKHVCPVCRARFRGATTCSRCGADLKTMMRLAVQAHRERQNARRCLREGRFENAADRTEAAEDLCATGAGRRLRLLTRWLRAMESEG